MRVLSLVLCYEIISIPFSILTFSRVRGHLAKKPLLVMGEGQGEWVFFFFLPVLSELDLLAPPAGLGGWEQRLEQLWLGRGLTV